MFLSSILARSLTIFFEHCAHVTEKWSITKGLKSKRINSHYSRPDSRNPCATLDSLDWKATWIREEDELLSKKIRRKDDLSKDRIIPEGTCCPFYKTFESYPERLCMVINDGIYTVVKKMGKKGMSYVGLSRPFSKS